MTPGWGEIGIGGLSSPPSISNQQQVHNLFGGLSLELRDSCHNNALLRIIPKFQISRGWHKQIPNHLIVDLHICDDNIVLVVWILLDVVEDVPDGEHAACDDVYLSPKVSWLPIMV